MWPRGRGHGDGTLMNRLRRLGRLAVVDITPLREVPGFRWLFGGMFLAQAGRQLAVVAIPIQVFDITGSTLAVGLIGLAQLIPLLAVSLVGGALADAMDRRRLLIVAQVVLALTAVGLWWNAAAAEPLLWPLYALSAVNSGISAIFNPARQALLPGLVGRRLFPTALALNQTQTNVAKTAVPAAGGLLIAVAGLPFTYAVEAALFVASGLLFLKVPEVDMEGGGRAFSLRSIREGPQLPEVAPAHPGGDAHGHQRDGVRDADRAVPGLRHRDPRWRRVHRWSAVRRTRGRCSRECLHLGLGEPGPTPRTRRDARHRRLGHGHRPVRPHAVAAAGSGVARASRRRGRDLGDLPPVDDPAERAGLPARPAVLHPHRCVGGAAPASAIWRPASWPR